MKKFFVTPLTLALFTAFAGIAQAQEQPKKEVAPVVAPPVMPSSLQPVPVGRAPVPMPAPAPITAPLKPVSVGNSGSQGTGPQSAPSVTVPSQGFVPQGVPSGLPAPAPTPSLSQPMESTPRVADMPVAEAVPSKAQPMAEPLKAKVQGAPAVGGTKPQVKKQVSSFKVTKGEVALGAGEKAKEFSAPIPGEVIASDRDYNQFVFSSGVKQVLFPEGAPLAQDPVYMAKNTKVLIQFSRATEKPVQAIFELEDGDVVTLYVKTRPMPGVVHKVKTGATQSTSVGGAKAQGQEPVKPGHPSAGDIKLIESLVQGKGLPGFDMVALPRVAKFDTFTVMPVAALADGATRKVTVFQLVSNGGKVAVVAPEQFYRPGVTAVMIDGDRVDSKASPMLYIVEEVGSDE